MPTLYCDLGDTRDVACGLAEPLHFEDGHAEVDDEDEASEIVARHKHIHEAGRHPDGDPGFFDDTEDEDDEPESDEFDAEAFVDRTPMGDVVEDIESGDYDDHLDAIEAEASRQGVQDAIESRRE